MKIAVLPDAQVKKGVPIDHLLHAGMYIADKKPDVIVNIGDWFDMPSLSSYDKGTKSFEGRRYLDDIESGNAAMELFMGPIRKEMKRLKHNKKKQWNPRFVYTMGNHENRINRAIEKDAVLDGVIGYDDFALKEWEVFPFLEPVVVGGVAFAHYFTSGVMGRPVSSAAALLSKKHMSCVMGHVQDRSIAYARRADGVSMTGLFCGICYQHDEEYLSSQTNGSWSGIWMLHNVKDGAFDEMPVPLSYLKAKYGK